MNLLGKIKPSAMSILNDPFRKDKWVAMHIHMYNENSFCGKNISATVEFENGNTKGEQKFTDDTFAGLVTQIENFIATLKWKSQGQTSG